MTLAHIVDANSFSLGLQMIGTAKFRYFRIRMSRRHPRERRGGGVTQDYGN